MAAPALAFTPPRLRADLTFARQDTPEGHFVVVKDPLSGKFFKLAETDEFIARQFDGATPLEEVRHRVEQRFDATVDTSTLAAFARTLQGAKLLDTGEKLHASRPKRVKGNLLRIQVRAFDPNELFARILPWVRWCYSPLFVAGAVALLLIGLGIVASRWGDIASESVALLRFTTIPLLIAVVFTVVSAHEFGHGLTCRYFGGEVHELGFLLLYLQPAFYCNVSDAWLFPQRYQRVWVSLAGPLVELLIWSFAAIAWWATEPDTTIHLLSLIVLASSGAHTLLNFNPFIKMDGYYLLSDLLHLPNLRRRSFAHVGNLIRRATGIGLAHAESLTTRERMVFTIYGTIASAGTFALLAYIIVSAGGYLVEGRQPYLMVLSTGLVGMRFRRRFKRLFGKKGVPDEDDDEDDGGIVQDDAIVAQEPSPPPVTRPVAASVAPPTRAAHTATKHAPRPAAPPSDKAAVEAEQRRERKLRERRARNRRRVAWALVAAAAIVYAAIGHLTLRVAGAFTILPEHNADVRSEVDGIVSDVLVTEGQHVNAGDVIVRLSAREQRAQLAGVNADIDRGRARLRLLLQGTLPDSIALARTLVTRAEDALKYAQMRRTRTQQLADSGFMTKVELEDALEASDNARNDLAEARNRLQVMLAGSRPEEIDAARAELERLDAQQRLLTTQLSLVDVRSPAEGVVATPERTLHELRGQLVAKGTLIAKVFEVRKVTIEIVVPEKDIADVQVGQPVLVRTRAYPGRTFNGTVVSIATAMQGSAIPTREDGASPPPTSSSSTKSILVTTEIENPDLLLKPGMSGQAKILCGDRPIRDLIARRFVRSVNLQVWSWW